MILPRGSSAFRNLRQPSQKMGTMVPTIFHSMTDRINHSGRSSRSISRRSFLRSASTISMCSRLPFPQNQAKVARNPGVPRRRLTVDLVGSWASNKAISCRFRFIDLMQLRIVERENKMLSFNAEFVFRPTKIKTKQATRAAAGKKPSTLRMRPPILCRWFTVSSNLPARSLPILGSSPSHQKAQLRQFL